MQNNNGLRCKALLSKIMNNKFLGKFCREFSNYSFSIYSFITTKNQVHKIHDLYSYLQKTFYEQEGSKLEDPFPSVQKVQKMRKTTMMIKKFR